LRADGGGVGGGDGPDDGQAKAVTPVAAGGARAEPLEGLEQAVHLGGRDDLPGVCHRQDGVTVAGRGGDLGVPAGNVVPDGVIPAEAWAGGLAAALLIAALAGLLPAIRAARLSPTQALWSL
jgi:hypothetical protein